MNLDPNIILRARGVELDGPMDLQAKALNMRQMALQNNQIERQNVQADKKLSDDQSYTNILKKNVVYDDKGNASVNKIGTMKDLYALDPQKAQAYQKSIMDQDIDMLKHQTDLSYALAFQTTPDNYQQIKQKAVELGLNNTDKWPEQFDPTFLQRWQTAVTSGKEQVDNKFREQEMQLKEKDLISRGLDRKEARDERRFQAGIKLDEKQQELATPYGAANTKDDAKQLKEAHESKSTFDNKLDQMIALREKNKGGNLFNRDDVARGKQLSKDLLLEYKNMAKLGVLSKADEDIINAIIPADPLEYNSPLAAIQGQDPVLTKLKSFKDDSDKDFQNRILTRTRAGIGQAAQKQQAPDKNTKMIGDQLYRKVEGGWLPAQK